MRLLSHKPCHFRHKPIHRKPSVPTLVEELKLCGRQRDVERGRGIHGECIRTGLDTNKYVKSSLVSMYARSREMLRSQISFDLMESHDTVTWNVLILGYAMNGEGFQALQTFGSLLNGGCVPNSGTFVASLKGCISLSEKEFDGSPVKPWSLDIGMAVHVQTSAWGLDGDILVASCLIDMYSKCGSVKYSRNVFDGMKTPDVVAWTAMMLGYVDNGEAELCLGMFQEMHHHGYVPNARTYLAALKACTTLAQREEFTLVDGVLLKLRCLDNGMALHSRALASKQVDTHVNNGLIGMYSQCAALEDARRVFDKMPTRDTISWTTLINGYVDCEDGQGALRLFSEMQSSGEYKADGMTYSAAVRACSKFAKNGNNTGQVIVLETGMAIHSIAQEKRFIEKDVFLANNLVDMYVKCGSYWDAHRVLERIKRQRSRFKTLPACNTLLDGYAGSDNWNAAVKVFVSMEEKDERTYAALLKACSRDDANAEKYGKGLHSEICRLELEKDAVLARSLMYFYAKTGRIADAQFLFDSSEVAHASVSTWTVLMAGYSRQCESRRVFDLFNKMQAGGVSPDPAAFVVVLTACNHSGLVEEGKLCFEWMRQMYGVMPGIEHYHCFMDLLGRANQVDCLVRILSSMPHEPNNVTLTSMLGALYANTYN